MIFGSSFILFFLLFTNSINSESVKSYYTLVHFVCQELYWRSDEPQENFHRINLYQPLLVMEISLMVCLPTLETGNEDDEENC